MSLEVIVVCLLAVGLLYHGFPLAWVVAVRARLKRRVTREKTLVLTFDDGPGDRLTPVILDFLRQNHSKATFFLLGRNIAGREHLIRRIVADGHEIGSHGYDHLHYWQTGPLRTLRDIREGWRAIDRALGRQGGVYPFRPPYGKMNLAGLVYLLRWRAPIVYWTHDTGDTWSVHQQNLRPMDSDGAVILIHDFDRMDTRVNEKIMAYIRTVLHRARDREQRVVTTSEFFGSAKG